MRRVGWLLTLAGVVLATTVWLPWIHTSAGGGGRASAIGGTVGSVVLPPGFGAGQLVLLLAVLLIVAGAMVGQSIVRRYAGIAAAILAVGELGCAAIYYRTNVHGPIAVAYGLWIAVGAAVIAFALSVLAALPGSSQPHGLRPSGSSQPGVQQRDD